MRPRVLASGLLALIAVACSGDRTITAPPVRLAPTAMNAIGTDPVTGATIETNQDDYLPGEVVHVTGHGWAPNEIVRLEMSEEPDTHADVAMDVQADASGAFSVHFYDVQEHDWGVTFTLVATGLTSGSSATATFTDGRNINSTTISPNPAESGVSRDVTVRVVLNTGTGPTTWTRTSWTITSGATVVAGPVCVDTPDHSTADGHGISMHFATFTVPAPLAPGIYAFTVSAHSTPDDCTDPDADNQTVSLTVTAASNTAPVLQLIPDQSVDEGSTLAFTAVATDENVATLAFSLANAASGTFPMGAAITSGGDFSWTPTEAQGPGIYRVKVVVTDDGGLTDEQDVQITVNEVNQAPTLDPIGDQSVDEGSELTFTATAQDGDVPANALTFSLGAGAPAGATIDPVTGVFSWTPPDGPASQAITIIVTDDGTPPLSAQEAITVTVNNVPPTITAVGLSPMIAGNIYPITQPVTVTATFTDPGALDTHTCASNAVALGAPAVSDGPNMASGGTCANTLSFLAAGVYDVTITVTDKDGGSDARTVQVIVYDPSAGFVTGGGWIDSPTGAYYADAELTGKATFGFVSKYKKGATVPDGNTQFVFHAGGFNFHSASYEFLIVNQGGSNAQFKGAGAVNGAPGYSFMLWATDGSPDKFRIKIWETATNSVVYDNLVGDVDGKVQPIANGSIVIHSPKK